MIRSMTGFGAATREEDGRRATAEIRSVNHRFLKVQLRLPAGLAALDSEVEAAVGRSIRRGAVSVSMTLDDPAARPRRDIDLDTAVHYRRAVEALWDRFGRKEPAWLDPVAPLLALPGVVRDAGDDAAAPPDEGLRRLILGTVEAAIEALHRARATEGGTLADVLAAHAERLVALVGGIAARAPSIPAELRDRAVQRVRGLLAGFDPRIPVSEPDLLRELCLLADRTDITEELNRLRSHIERFAAILREGGEAGRRLDFLLQEMAREANTVGSKANDASIAHDVVEMKCEIERMKEQVQNLE